MMDWMTLISNIITSIAWPTTVITVVFMLKYQLEQLIGRLSRVKWKEAEAVFSETIIKLAKETSEITSPNNYKSTALQDTAEHLRKLASISPKSAILEAFCVLENAAIKAAKLSPKYSGDYKGIINIIQLLTGKPLMAQHGKQIFELFKLRNQVAHSDTFDMSRFLVQEYIDICLSIADFLQNYVCESKMLGPSSESGA